MKKISIISPCFNEEDNVEYCYNRIKDIFYANLPNYSVEHIFSDNCSTDKTVEILRKISNNDKNVKVVINSRNFGPFRSIFNALKYATGDAVLVFLPVDLQDPPELIPEMIRHWESGIEIIAGARVNREETFLLRACRKIFYRISNTLSEFEIPEDVGEFQLIDRKVWEAVVKHHDQYPYIRGIIASTGFKRLIIPYTWKARRRGISKNNLFSLIDQALNGIFSFTSAPLRVCSMLGAVIAVLALVYAVVSFSITLFNKGEVPPGIPTIIVSIFFFSGIQLIFIGMLGEYITAIHAQVRRGPLVVEREKINIDI